MGAMAPDPADTALFVRIPQAQARALDRLAFETRRPKRAVVSDMLGSYIDGRRIPAVHADEPALGWHSFRATQSDVLTLEGVAELLEVEPELIVELAEKGELPGRRIGGEWRFARAGVLAWLALVPPPDPARGVGF
jgi:excisionase family DNA binding protein